MYGFSCSKAKFCSQCDYMEKSGEIGRLDDADEVEGMVGFATDLNRHTAGDLLPTLEKISTKFAREAIVVRGSEIFIKVPFTLLREARVKLAALGIPRIDVTFEVVD